MSETETKTETEIEAEKSFSRQLISANTFVKKTLLRVDKISDPSMKHTVFLNSIFMMIDGINVSFDTMIEQKTIPADAAKKIKETTELFEKLVNQLFEWVASPVYSPDHPFGNTLMMTAKENFKKNQEQQ